MRNLFLLFSAVLLIHIVVIGFTGTFQIPFLGGVADFQEYEGQAREIAQRLEAGNFSLHGLDLDHYFPVFVGYLSFLFGFSIFLGQVLNAVIVAISALLLYALCKELGGSHRLSFLIALGASVLYPTYLLYSSLFLEDAFVILFTLASLFAGFRALQSPTVGRILLWYAFLLLASEFRSFLGWFLGGAFLVSFILFANLPLKSRLTRVLGVCLLLVILPFVAELLPQVSGYGDYGHSLNREFEHLKEIPAIIGGLPWSILGPIPWTLEGQKALFGLGELILWFLVLPFVVQGLALARERFQGSMYFLVFAFFVFGGIALFISDPGMVMRLRIPAFLALLPFLSL